MNSMVCTPKTSNRSHLEYHGGTYHPTYGRPTRVYFDRCSRTGACQPCVCSKPANTSLFSPTCTMPSITAGLICSNFKPVGPKPLSQCVLTNGVFILNLFTVNPENPGCQSFGTQEDGRLGCTLGANARNLRAWYRKDRYGSTGWYGSPTPIHISFLLHLYVQLTFIRHSSLDGTSPAQCAWNVIRVLL